MALYLSDVAIAAEERTKEEEWVVKTTIRGKLVKKDYEIFVPKIEKLVEQYGRIRLLVKLIDFHGWTAGALWEDTKFAARHFTDIERLAIVGEKSWQKGMATFCKPFTRAEIRYFDLSEVEDAEAWIKEVE